MKHSTVCEPPQSIANDEIRERRFREAFQCAWRESIRHGFGKEESFEFIWAETMERFPLQSQDEIKLRLQLQAWVAAF